MKSHLCEWMHLLPVPSIPRLSWSTLSPSVPPWTPSQPSQLPLLITFYLQPNISFIHKFVGCSAKKGHISLALYCTNSQYLNSNHCVKNPPTTGWATISLGHQPDYRPLFFVSDTNSPWRTAFSPATRGIMTQKKKRFCHC